MAKQPELVAAYRARKTVKANASAFDILTMTTKELKLKHRLAPQSQKK